MLTWRATPVQADPTLCRRSTFSQMKIKRVEIIGFKSFVDRVSLDFQAGVAGIVGPNGCGKSNIVDAIRWVMGEQNAKNLRGRAMEDVIFGGSESRKPHGMAEVSMTFANEDGIGPPAFRDYAEIMVTRRLYRNGDSEYLINKTPCRLLDISELFMDTGVGARTYSIIEQGKIGQILSAKPEDRRSLIEEAAGVTKFKSRKKAALRKIDATRQNLVRLSDIIAEVRRQTSSLKRQARKAERFREYREELRGIETRFAAGRYRQLQAALAADGSREVALQQRLAALEAQQQGEELALDEARLQQLAREKELAAVQERVFHLSSELQKTESRIELADNQIRNQTLQHERLAGELADVARRLEELDQEEATLRGSQGQLGADLAREAGRLQLAEQDLARSVAEENERQQLLEEARAALYRLLTDLTRYSSQQEDAERRLAGLDQRSGRSRAEVIGVREQMEEIRRQCEALEGSLDSFRQRREALLAEREECREALLAQRRRSEENEATLLVRREEHNRARSRLESLQQLEQNLEGYGRGVRLVLGDDELRQSFAGMVADALEVAAGYEAAVEAVLGERLQTILAPRTTEVAAAFDRLRAADSRCSFLLPGFSPAATGAVPGGQPLDSLVTLRPDFAPLVGSLLQGIWVVPDLEPFLHGGLPEGTTLVTAAGEVLTARGELTGGARTALDQGLLHKKREMKELAGQVAAFSRQVEGLQRERDDLRQAMTASDEQLRELEAALHRKELKLVDSEKDLVRLRGELDRFEERLEVLSLEEAQLHEEHEELQRLLGTAAQGRLELEAGKLAAEERVGRLQEELLALRRQSEAAREQVTALKMTVVSLREREEGSRSGIERLARLRSELQGRRALILARQGEGEQEQQTLRETIERARIELDLLYQRREEEKEGLDQRRDGFEEFGAGILLREEELRALRGRVSQARDELGGLQLAGRELQLEAEHLRQTILDRYRVDLGTLPPAEPQGEDVAAGERRLEELRRLIDEMGEVNLTAIEEYEELEERHLFLTTQQEDLRESLNGLQTAIARINRTTRKRFRETFDQVNAKFREVFPRLFRGGQAELRLTDEEDLLETGIDIVVQPPGKKLQNVSLLSGGEKALTAVALIFSIFLIKPSPFCILDEVDAPLDDANIGRFNELVGEMAGMSQFIIITHNKRTMEIADSLYGVTMEEPGVSKLVSVRINEF
ncbi:chromosome segregation ATPase SMC [Desulfuromonas sp. DDH964]|nr:chromosome segregation ATPase SMC [Desulfuromonas sp. DDH964]